jgi:hypothetical protein
MLLALEADVRTDCNRYRVYKDGEVIDEPRDILKYWRDDLVSFLLPCSYGFEGVCSEVIISNSAGVLELISPAYRRFPLGVLGLSIWLSPVGSFRVGVMLFEPFR